MYYNSQQFYRPCIASVFLTVNFSVTLNGRPMALLNNKAYSLHVNDAISDFKGSWMKRYWKYAFIYMKAMYSILYNKCYSCDDCSVNSLKAHIRFKQPSGQVRVWVKT